MRAFIIIIILEIVSICAFSQNNSDTLNKLKISGYLQFQYQHFFVGDSLGSTPQHFAKYYGGDFINEINQNRFTIRRGRIKITHEANNAKANLSFDITEKGFEVKDLNLKYSEKYLNAFSLTAGLFYRPFGNELSYSSSLRESPERARVIQTTLPKERDLGLMLTFKMPKEYFLNILQIDAALVNGNGAAVETDNYKDFIGRLQINTPENFKKISFSCGVSYYKGYVNHVYEPVDTISTNVSKKYYIYKFEEITDSLYGTYKAFVVDTLTNRESGMYGTKILREYFSIDAQLKAKTVFGEIEIRGEYMWGTQPSFVYTNSFDKPSVIYNDIYTDSPTGPVTGVAWPIHKVPQPYRPVKVDSKEIPHNTMIRKFNGGYIYFIQNILETNHQIVIKYDWYDPNTEIKGNEISTDYIFDTTDSLATTYISPADLKYTTWGFGWNWKITENVKLMLYYERVINEKAKIKAYEGDLNQGWHPAPSYKKNILDDVFTFRIQYKF